MPDSGSSVQIQHIGSHGFSLTMRLLIIIFIYFRRSTEHIDQCENDEKAQLNTITCVNIIFNNFFFVLLHDFEWH